MGNLLETLMKQAALDAEEQAELISYEDARVVSAESESFGLGQEIWWKPDPTTSELGPGTILFRKIDYKLQTVNQGPDIMENGSSRSFFCQMVSKVLVECQGRECLVMPSTITRWGAIPPDNFFGTADAIDNFVSCECDESTVGPCFDMDYCSCPCRKLFERGICWICGAIARIPVANPELIDPGLSN